MSFFAGLATGVGNELQAGQERTRKRVEEQIAEARNYVEVARKRQAAAEQTKAQIMNASKSYGVNPNVLFSAYRDGNFDRLVSLYQKAQETGQQVSPEILSSWYTVPASVEMDDETRSKEIDRIFGVIEQGIVERGGVDDATGAELLFNALTGGGEREVQRRLRGRTVGGYDAEALLNMGSPETPQGVGGNINPDAFNWLRENKPGGDESDNTQITAGDVRTAEIISEPFVNRLMGLYGGRFNSEQNQTWLTSQIQSDITKYVAEERLAGRPAPREIPDEFMSNYVREKDGLVYIVKSEQDKDGNPLWQAVDEKGTLTGQPMPWDVIESGAEAPAPAADTETPSSVNPQANRPQEKTVPLNTFPQVVEGAVFTGKVVDGNPVYRLPNGKEKIVPSRLLEGFEKEPEPETVVTP